MSDSTTDEDDDEEDGGDDDDAMMYCCMICAGDGTRLLNASATISKTVARGLVRICSHHFNCFCVLFS